MKRPPRALQGDCGLRLCFVNLVPVSLEAASPGGAERQVLLLALALRGRGHEVIIVAPGRWRGPAAVVGIRILSGWDDTGSGGLRYAMCRLPSLRRMLVRLGADAYYCRGFSLHSPTVVGAAAKGGTVSMVALSHDTDLEASRLNAAVARKDMRARLRQGACAQRYFARFGLRRASAVLAQTHDQVAVCRESGIRATLVRNIVELPRSEEEASASSRSDVVWVGSLSQRKGVPALLDLVKLMPDARFIIVGDSFDRALKPLRDCLEASPNAQLLGSLPHDEVMTILGGARVVINTSTAEGFSNVFLEAWSRGTPVVSLNVNPDGLLSGERAFGYSCAGSVVAMAEYVRTLLRDDALAAHMGKVAREYVSAFHSPEVVCTAFEGLLK